MKPIRTKAAFILASGVLLTACGGGGTGTGTTAGGGGGETVVEDETVVVAENTYAVPEDLLPNYIPIELVEPDFPSVAGSPPGFLTLPELVQAFDTPPGSGSHITAMTPLWGTIPSTVGNQYFDAVNAAMGTDIEFQISDGNTYGEKIATALASPATLPDWVLIPSWNVPPRFYEGVGNIFEDLTPYLSGDNVEEYPFLANIPTESWQACQWNGRLYGIPMPQALGLGDWTMYRSDIIQDPEFPTNADEFMQFVEDNHTDEHWAAEDLWTTVAHMFGVTDWRLDENGNLLNKVETPEYAAALQYMQDMFASGAVHPDAVAGQVGDSQQRFESGNPVLISTGIGFWHESLTRMRAIDPNYDVGIMPVIAADGGDPIIWKNVGAGFCSYIKQTDDEAKIREILADANFLASPFGTKEFQLINYGVEGVHYNLDADGIPVMTDLGLTEVQPTYIFLVGPPAVNARVTLPEYVEEYSEWTAENYPLMQEPLFYGMRINEPPQYSALGQPFVDLEADIARGRADMSDLEAAVENWRASGGNELREFYQNILDSQH